MPKTLSLGDSVRRHSREYSQARERHGLDAPLSTQSRDVNDGSGFSLQ
jgi:hypothetical protein